MIKQLINDILNNMSTRQVYECLKTSEQFLNITTSKGYIPFTQEQLDTLIGIILGAGSLSDRGLNFRLQFKQSTIHYDYAMTINDIFKDITSKPRIQIHKTINSLTNMANRSVEITTRVHPELTKLGNLFYIDKVKVVPSNIHELLTPRSLAFWG